MNTRPAPPYSRITPVNTNARSNSEVQQVYAALNSLIEQFNALVSTAGGLKVQIDWILKKLALLYPYDGLDEHDPGYISNEILKNWPNAHWLLKGSADLLGSVTTLIDVFISPTVPTVTFTAAAGPVYLLGNTFFDVSKATGIGKNEYDELVFLAANNFVFQGNAAPTIIASGSLVMTFLEAVDATGLGGVGTATNHVFSVYVNNAEVARFDLSGRMGLGKEPDVSLPASSFEALGSIKAAQFIDAGLTSGRVVYATTSGQLADSANLTWNNATGYLDIVGVLEVKSDMNIINPQGTVRTFVKGSGFGYNPTAYPVVVVGAAQGFGEGALALAYNPSAVTGGNFQGDGSEILTRNLTRWITPNAGDTDFVSVMTWNNQAVTFAKAVTAEKYTSTIAIGTAPLAVTSTTVCANLNADLWDGHHLPTLDAGKYLKNSAGALSWDTPSGGLPADADGYLKNVGSTKSWDSVVDQASNSYFWDSQMLPDLAAGSGKFLYSNGSTMSWEEPAGGTPELPSQSSHATELLTTDGSTPAWTHSLPEICYVRNGTNGLWPYSGTEIQMNGDLVVTGKLRFEV